MEKDMWGVLIADDEPKIRRGLRAQLSRLELPLRVVAEAEDGEMALEAAEKYRPDILLVDINMPFMNGLAFISALRRTRADARIIVITGYEEFEYARQALEMNVQAYLLKPLDIERLRAALEAAIEGLQNERQRNRHFEWAIAQIGARRDFLREEFLRDAVAGRVEADEIREFRVYFDFPSPVRMMLMLIFAPGEEGEKPWQHLLRQYAVQDALRLAAPALDGYCLFSDDRGNVLMLYDAPEDMDEAICTIVRDTLGEDTGIALEPLASLTRLAETYDAAMERRQASRQLSPVVEAAKKFIGQHYAEPALGLNDVAGALGLHPSYLSRLMKQELGLPFSKYLTNVRISKAIELMRDPNRRIWQVAEAVGYSGGNYFSVAFKKVLGVAPADYRLEEQRR